MRTIENLIDGENKFGDTSTIFQLRLHDTTDRVFLDNKPITLNIANASGLVISKPLEQFTGDIITLDFNDPDLASLTPDFYKLEFEVTQPDGDISKYPTEGGMPFKINQNLKATSGQLVPTVTFDVVLEAVDEKVNNYLATVVKGDKGDTGPVGPMGEVDTSKDYTFTGYDKFLNPIDGSLKTRQATFTDFVEVANHMYDYAGNWFVSATQPMSNAPVNSTFYTVAVIPGDISSSGKIVVLPYDGPSLDGAMYYNIVNWQGLGAWRKLAQDAQVIHNTGNETAAGDKTLTGIVTATQPIVGSVTGSAATANDPNAIHKTGDETVAGTKTFTEKPLLENGAKIGNTGTEINSDSIELYGPTPYIDLHFANNANDYTTRIIEFISGVLSFIKIDGSKAAIDTIIKERGTLTGTVDVLSMANAGAANSGIWKLSAVTIANSGQIDNIWGTLQINPVGDGSGAELIIISSSGFGGMAQLISYGDVSLSQLTWRKLANDSAVVHTTGTETVAGDKTFTGTNTFSGQTSFWFKQIQWTTGNMQGTWYIQRLGNWVNARFEKTGTVSTGTTPVALPVGYRPINPWILDLEVGNAGMNSNGTLYIGTAYSGNTSMTFSYPTNDAWPTA